MSLYLLYPGAKQIPPVQKGKNVPLENEPQQTNTAAVEEKPVFERAIYIFPYKSPDYTPKLQSIVNEINMKAFGITDGNPLFLTTKALTEDEKKDKELDIITGVEFIDNQYRTFILEGISEKGMKR